MPGPRTPFYAGDEGSANATIAYPGREITCWLATDSEPAAGIYPFSETFRSSSVELNLRPTF